MLEECSSHQAFTVDMVEFGLTQICLFYSAGLLNSFSSVDHHAFSDNSVDPSR